MKRLLNNLTNIHTKHKKMKANKARKITTKKSWPEYIKKIANAAYSGNFSCYSNLKENEIFELQQNGYIVEGSESSCTGLYKISW